MVDFLWWRGFDKALAMYLWIWRSRNWFSKLYGSCGLERNIIWEWCQWTQDKQDSKELVSLEIEFDNNDKKVTKVAHKNGEDIEEVNLHIKNTPKKVCINKKLNKKIRTVDFFA